MRCPQSCKVALVACVVAQAGCTADVPELGGDGSVETPCSPQADLVVSFNDENGVGGTEGGDASLGPADGSSVTIGQGAVLTVGFIGLGLIENLEGDDLRIVGSTVEDTTVSVYVAVELEDTFEFAGMIEHDPDATEFAIDLNTAKASFARYVQIVGLTGTFTVDAVESLTTSCN